MAKALHNPALLITRIRKQLALGASGDMEAIHALRVSLKKLRPFMDAMRKVDHQGLILDRDYSRIRKLFKTAGALRMVQLLRVLITGESGEIPVPLIGRLELAEAQAMTAWLTLLKRYERCLPASLTRIQRALKRINPKSLAEAMGQILFWQSAKLRRDAKSLHAEEDLHRVRKFVKQILVCQGYLQIPEWVTWAEMAAQLANALGLRHDLFDAVQYLHETGLSSSQELAQMIHARLRSSFADEASKVKAMVEMLPSS